MKMQQKLAETKLEQVNEYGKDIKNELIHWQWTVYCNKKHKLNKHEQSVRNLWGNQCQVL
jgi:hypothetical protein